MSATGIPEPPLGGFIPVSNVSTEYREATERLANASVAKHRADKEFSEAMMQFAEARGAARARGL